MFEELVTVGRVVLFFTVPGGDPTGQSALWPPALRLRSSGA